MFAIISFVFDVLIELSREDVAPLGCVVMSGNNTTLYTVCGTEIIQHISIDVDLPNKHGRGGQSKLRFERIAEEARHNYISKVIETLLRVFPKDLPLIVGGCAYLKNKMSDRLGQIADAPKILRIVDIQYDKRIGLNSMISQCTDLLSSLQVAKERKWISTFMDAVSADTNLAVYGQKNIDYCLLNGLVSTLLVHEDIFTDDIKIICDKYDTELVIITNFLPEANQIQMGFGGKVGILRYPINLLEDIELSHDSTSNCDELSTEIYEY